jgi:hypothetical protein
MTYVRVQPFEYELFVGFLKLLFAYMLLRDIFLYAIPWAVNIVVKWVEYSLVKVSSVAVDFAQDAAEDIAEAAQGVAEEVVETIGEAATVAGGIMTRSVAAARAAEASTKSTDEATDDKKTS